MAIREELWCATAVSHPVDDVRNVEIVGKGRVTLFDNETCDGVGLGTVETGVGELRALLRDAGVPDLFDQVERATAAWEVWAATEEREERDRDDRSEIEAALNAEYYANRL